MPPARSLDYSLLPHAVRPPAAQIGTVRLTLHSNALSGSLHLAYGLEGDLAGLALPPPAHSLREDRLWEHTCFELFVAGASGEHYVEYNFAPSLAWQAYGFSTYREPDAALSERVPLPHLRSERGVGWLQLDVALQLAPLRKLLGGGPLRFGATAVLEDRAGALSYWATMHSDVEKPDFHLADSVTLPLAE